MCHIAAETPIPTYEARKQLSSFIKLDLFVSPRTELTGKHHELSFCFPGVVFSHSDTVEIGEVLLTWLRERIAIIILAILSGRLC